MIRISASYRLAVDDFETVDAFGDQLLRSLVDDDVHEPDIAISMSERTLEVVLLIDTGDEFEAIARGNEAIRVAASADRQILTAGCVLRAEPVST